MKKDMPLRIVSKEMTIYDITDISYKKSIDKDTKEHLFILEITQNPKYQKLKITLTSKKELNLNRVYRTENEKRNHLANPL